MTLEQSQFMSDNPQYHSASPLSDGGLVVGLGTGSTLTKISAQAIQGNDYRNQAYETSRQANPNLKGQAPSESRQILHNLDASKLKSMIQAVNRNENSVADVDATIANIRTNPELFTQLQTRFDASVNSENYDTSKMSSAQDRNRDLNEAQKRKIEASNGLPSEK